MIYRFPRPGFKLLATLGTLIGGGILSFSVGAFFMVQHVRSVGFVREVWGTLLLLSQSVIWGLVVAQIWSVCTKEELLFQGKVESLKLRYPKGVRFAECWFFSAFLIALVTLVAYAFWSPEWHEQHGIVAILALVAYGFIIRCAVKRTRKICRLRQRAPYDYGD